MTKTNWRIAVCCNHPDNGMDTGRCGFFEVRCGDHQIRLDGPERRFEWFASHFKFSRRKFSHVGMREWVGNWCWDECATDRETARAFLYYLAELGFSMEEASDVLWNWYKRTQAQIKRYNERMAKP